MSRLPSWKYDVNVISEIWLHQSMHKFNWRTILQNFTPIHFQWWSLRLFLEEVASARSTRWVVIWDQFLLWKLDFQTKNIFCLLCIFARERGGIIRMLFYWQWRCWFDTYQSISRRSVLIWQSSLVWLLVCKLYFFVLLSFVFLFVYCVVCISWYRTLHSKRCNTLFLSAF